MARRYLELLVVCSFWRRKGGGNSHSGNGMTVSTGKFGSPKKIFFSDRMRKRDFFFREIKSGKKLGPIFFSLSLSVKKQLGNRESVFR